MSARPFRYHTDCVSSTAELIGAMRDSPHDRVLTYSEFRGAVEGLNTWAWRHGYDKDLKLKNDWAVSFHESVYDGLRCYYLQWSGIEFIWTTEGAGGEDFGWGYGSIHVEQRPERSHMSGKRPTTGIVVASQFWGHAGDRSGRVG